MFTILSELYTSLTILKSALVRILKFADYVQSKPVQKKLKPIRRALKPYNHYFKTIFSWNAIMGAVLFLVLGFLMIISTPNVIEKLAFLGLSVFGSFSFYVSGPGAPKWCYKVLPFLLGLEIEN